MASQTINSAERIRELSSINGDVAAMLTAAGQAINALTDKPLGAPAAGDGDTNMADSSDKATLDARKQALQQNTTAFYDNLQAITARLRRQAYALEEAGIITPEAASLSNISVQAAKQPNGGPPGRAGQGKTEQPERITNGGLGNQDIGWLNSRGNRVGAGKERELVEDARKLAEDVLERRTND